MTGPSRRAVVVALLEHWPEFFDVASSGNIASGDAGSGLPLLSAMSRHPSVVELQRCLERVRSSAKNHYRFVVEYFDSEWRIATRLVPMRNAHGRVILDRDRRPRVVEVRARARVLPREFRSVPACSCGCGFPRPVCLAVDAVCFEWDGRVACEVPLPLTAELRPVVDPESGEQVWTERRVA